ncbi:MAG: FUSC family protein, partial [Thermomicrobiaceae bacterium]|nr:FUSC family protein [Thermomicrobiaceae bacterium]
MRQVLGRLREWGLGERVIKTALAAALAWEVAVVVTRNPRPYLAPLVAILTLQITIAQSVSRAVQRIFGVILGVVMALLVTHVIGVHVWSIALLVAVAFAVGTRLRLGPYAPPEAAITALLVMLIGSTTRIEYALVRMVDTLIGAVVGVAVNAAIVPPSYLPDVRRAVEGLAAGAAGAHREQGD